MLRPPGASGQSWGLYLKLETAAENHIPFPYPHPKWEGRLEKEQSGWSSHNILDEKCTTPRSPWAESLPSKATCHCLNLYRQKEEHRLQVQET